MTADELYNLRPGDQVYMELLLAKVKMYAVIVDLYCINALYRYRPHDGIIVSVVHVESADFRHVYREGGVLRFDLQWLYARQSNSLAKIEKL